MRQLAEWGIADLANQLRKQSESDGVRWFKAVFLSDESTLSHVADYIRTHYGDHFTLTSSSPTLLELQPLGVSKGYQNPVPARAVSGLPPFRHRGFRQRRGDAALCGRRRMSGRTLPTKSKKSRRYTSATAVTARSPTLSKGSRSMTLSLADAYNLLKKELSCAVLHMRERRFARDVLSRRQVCRRAATRCHPSSARPCATGRRRGRTVFHGIPADKSRFPLAHFLR